MTSIGRRGFLGLASGTLAAVGLGRLTTSSSLDDVPVLGSAANWHSPGNLGFVRVGHVPAGFVEGSRLVNGMLGFIDAKGEQLHLIYHNMRLAGRFLPLSIVITEGYAERLSMVAGGETMPVTIGMSSGETVRAAYYSGIWLPSKDGAFLRSCEPDSNVAMRFRWATDAAHALVMHVGQYSVAIRGPRAAGVTDKELFKISASITM